MEKLYYEIFEGLPRQGPGSNPATKRALELVDGLPRHPTILDIGCGTGMQTLQLAEHIGGTIYAIDNHKPFLDELLHQAEIMGYTESIRTELKDMRDLDFPHDYFDIIWAEGSIYILGFDSGLNYLRSFIKPGGYLAATDITWLKNDQPDEILVFWEQEYPGMKSIGDNLEIISKNGFRLADYFILSPTAWWDNYYEPLEGRLGELRRKYLENDDALEIIEFTQLEIDLYRKYPDYYGYVFYVMQKLK